MPTITAIVNRTAALVRFASLCLAGTVAVGLLGCGAPRHAMDAIIGLDTSDSARKDFKGGALVAASVAERLRAGRDGLRLFRVDHDCREIGTGKTLGDSEATLALIGSEMKSRSKQHGTLPERFWEQVAAQVGAAKTGRPLVIVLATDGDNDDLRPESRRKISGYIARLAASSRVRGVVLYGVRPSNMEAIRQQFAPLGERFHPFTSGENNPDVAAGIIVGCA
jgi:hypothetical protein